MVSTLLKGGLFLLLAFLISTRSFADIKDYQYPNSTYPSISNYGTSGLINVPTARFFNEGSLAVSINDSDPYTRLSIIAYPFSWFEASYQYTDIKNALYSDVPAFSGGQTYKDKSFDFKFKVFDESRYFPAVAVGLRDVAGTAVFSSEYVTASKKIKDFDVSVGVGWGAMSKDDFSNPLSRINSRFEERTKNANTRGGDFNLGYLFSGDISFFGAIEYTPPNLYGLRFRAEIDPIDYSKEGFPDGRDSFQFAFEGVRPSDSKVNFGVLYPVNDNFHLKLSYVKGNTLSLGFSLHRDLGRKNKKLVRSNRKKDIPNSAAVKIVTSKSRELHYKATLKYLADENFYVQTADIKGDTLSVVFQQSIHQSWMRSNGRVIDILDEISPDYIKNFKVANINAGLGMYSVEINRDEFKQNKRRRYYKLAERNIIYDEFNFEQSDYQFQPTVPYPSHFYRIGPVIRSQLGGPDGFFFGNARLYHASETLFRRNISLITSASVGLYDNFDDLKLASDSILPHVRTDIVKYLKGTEKFSVEQFQINYFKKFHSDIYARVSAGIFEMMFMGIGGEILYRPFFHNFGIGAEIWDVKQRDYKGRLGTLDYSTLTGHINLFYHEPNTQILFAVKGGRFLAKDSGINFDFSRTFKTGLRIGAYFSRTDISRFEFGEGSFDKGFYFYIPLELFFNSYSKRKTAFGIRPVTRDGAAYLNTAMELWGVTEQAHYNNLFKDIDDFYD